MKKFTALLLVCILTVAILPVHTLANTDITVIIHGERLDFPDGKGPIILDGRVLVPIHGVFEALGFDVFWNSEDKEVRLVRGLTFITITINSDIFSVHNGVSSITFAPAVNCTLGVPAQMVNNTTYVPIRCVLESVGYNLEWNSVTRTVVVSSKTGRVITFMPESDDVTGITNARLSEMVANSIIPTDVTHLRLCNHEISDISPLRHLPNLVELILTDNQISDISPLRELSNLRVLDLQNNQVVDIAPLSELPNLRALNLVNNQVADIAQLGKLIYLRGLHLAGNPFSDITPIANLTNLEAFSIGENWSFDGDISIVNNFSDLRFLRIGQGFTTDFSPIGTLMRLEHLSFFYVTQISDISFLENLVNLESLTLSATPLVTDYSALSNLTQLTFLELHNSTIQDFEIIGELVNLQTLRLSNMYVGDPGIQALGNLSSLTNLHLDVVNISDIYPLSRLINLSMLWLSGNQIEDVSPLGNLSELRVLWISNNNVTDVLPLRNLVNLEYLIIDGNPLNQVKFTELKTMLSNLTVFY